MVYKDILANGMRVLTEELPHLHSVATGVWAGIGAAHEPGELGGISHYLEHMLFKGTKNRNAKELAEEIESVGGRLTPLPPESIPAIIQKQLMRILVFL